MGVGLEVPQDSSLSSSFGSREEHLNIGSPFQDDLDVAAAEFDLHLSLQPGSLLQFFREKREAVVGGIFLPNFLWRLKSPCIIASSYS